MAEEVNSIAAKPVVSTKPAEKVEEKKKRGRKPVFKLTQFDHDLLHLLREGTGTPQELIAHLGVAEHELNERVKVLKEERLVTEENGAFRLTVNGYNFYTVKGAKKVSLKKSFTGEVKLQKHKKSDKREQAVDAPAQKHVNDFLSSTEVVDLGGKLGRMDLQEIIKRYGPSQEQRSKFLQDKAVETVTQKAPVAAAPVMASSTPGASGETCDLCKSGFKLVLNDSTLAKYGHCFCGAAYHKECYDSLLGDSAKCIRCGKKLFLIVDKQSREAISGLRDAFE